MSTTKLELSASDLGTCVRVVPPQTNDDDTIAAGKGAYCFVIDVSGSMNAAAQITTDDGDKVNHGWSQLDIAKHSTNTFVSSLADDDYVSVVTYSDGANVLLDWTKCTAEGRERAIAAIHSMRPERSTNLMAGITTGYAQFDAFPEPDASLSEYGLNLVITTDGMPSSQWHPARGRDGYSPLCNTLAKGLTKKRSEGARPVVTTIGIGFQLDSELLTKMSSTFLHMPDPGQIGPFIVNLLAAVRSTARLPSAAGGAAANNCALLISPAAALRADVAPVPGFENGCETIIDADGLEVLRVPLGTILYDQPRHVMLSTAADAGAFSVALEVRGQVVLTTPSSETKPADAATQKLAAVQTLRLKAAKVLSDAVVTGSAGSYNEEAVAAPLTALVEELKGCAYATDAAVKALAATLEQECVLGTQAQHFNKWGAHYFRTLPCMLRAERRSNFRDECLQHFGKDARLREALFEAQSQTAEMRFATLTPPEPSLLRPQYTPAVGVAIGGAQPATAAPPPRPTVLPDEFMRGGGCFGPAARVLLASPDGGARPVRVAEVKAGDVLVGEGGSLAPVRCVVLTECPGGRAQLTRLPNGPEITEWHPVREPSGRWRFPNMLGARVVVRTPYVYNLVLAPGHPTLLVDGVPCAALGHGLEGEVVGHPYWGTEAVIADLSTKPGWAAGRVVLPATEA